MRRPAWLAVPAWWVTPAWLRRVGNWILYFPWALLAFSLLAIGHGMRFLGFGGPIDRPPQGLEFLTQVFPLPVYAGLWLFAGGVCVLAMFKKFRALTWYATGSFAGMCAMWFIFYTAGYIHSILNGRPSAIYYIAELYLGLLLLPAGELFRLWREEKASE